MPSAMPIEINTKHRNRYCIEKNSLRLFFTRISLQKKTTARIRRSRQQHKKCVQDSIRNTTQ